MSGTLEDVAWDLDPLVDSEGEAGADRLLTEAQDRSAAFAERFQGRVADIDGPALADAVAELQAISELVGKAGTYAMLRFATDTAEPRNGALDLARKGVRTTNSLYIGPLKTMFNEEIARRRSRR